MTAEPFAPPSLADPVDASDSGQAAHDVGACNGKGEDALARTMIGRRRALVPVLTRDDGYEGRYRSEDQPEGEQLEPAASPAPAPAPATEPARGRGPVALRELGWCETVARPLFGGGSRKGPACCAMHRNAPTPSAREDLPQLETHSPGCPECMECVAHMCAIETQLDFWDRPYTPSYDEAMHALIDFWDYLLLEDPRATRVPTDAELHNRRVVCVRACFLTLTAAAPLTFRTSTDESSAASVGKARALNPKTSRTLADWATACPTLPVRPEPDVAVQILVAAHMRTINDAAEAAANQAAAELALAQDAAPPADAAAKPQLAELEADLRLARTERDEAVAAAERATSQLKSAIAETDRLRAELAASRERHESQLETLRGKMSGLREVLSEERLDAHAAHDARRHAESTLRALQRRLVDAGWYDLANEEVVAETDPVPQPVNFLALVDQAEAYAALGVHLTAAPRERERLARILDEHDTTGDAAAQAWETLLALADYRRAKHEGVFDGNLYNYLETPPVGFRTVGLAKFASNESAATMTAYGHEREFAIPTTVFASGTVRMAAHFRLGRVGGMSAPRLHLFDHTAAAADGARGDVYVGYIGPHLRNRGTN